MRNFRRLSIFAVVTSFLLATAAAPAIAAAANPFDMNDRFSTLGAGEAGQGKIQLKQGEAVLQLKVRDLAANHDYLVHVTVDFDPALTITFPVTTDDRGKFKVKNDLGLAAGTYRLDIFVTHPHPTVMPGDGADGDFLWGFLGNSQALLSCQPFVMLTVP